MSGWKNQAEVARKLDLTPGGVSEIFSGGTKPSPRLLKYFRLVLFQEKPELVGGEIREDAPRGETAIWKGRAQKAEVEVHRLRTGLRKLLDETSATPAPAVSSAERAEDEEILDALEESEGSSSALHERSPQAAAPSAGVSSHEPAGGRASKVRPASPKRVPK